MTVLRQDMGDVGGVWVVTLRPAGLGMVASEPIAPAVRLALSQWPDDAPREAVSTFCAEFGISRTSFYELRKRGDARWAGRGAWAPVPASEVEPSKLEVIEASADFDER